MFNFVLFFKVKKKEVKEQFLNKITRLFLGKNVFLWIVRIESEESLELGKVVEISWRLGWGNLWVRGNKSSSRTLMWKGTVCILKLFKNWFGKTMRFCGNLQLGIPVSVYFSFLCWWWLATIWFYCNGYYLIVLWNYGCTRFHELAFYLIMTMILQWYGYYDCCYLVVLIIYKDVLIAWTDRADCGN